MGEHRGRGIVIGAGALLGGMLMTVPAGAATTPDCVGSTWTVNGSCRVADGATVTYYVRGADGGVGGDGGKGGDGGMGWTGTATTQGGAGGAGGFGGRPGAGALIIGTFTNTSGADVILDLVVGAAGTDGTPGAPGTDGDDAPHLEVGFPGGLGSTGAWGTAGTTGGSSSIAVAGQGAPFVVAGGGTGGTGGNGGTGGAGGSSDGTPVPDGEAGESGQSGVSGESTSILPSGAEFSVMAGPATISFPVSVDEADPTRSTAGVGGSMWLQAVGRSASDPCPSGWGPSWQEWAQSATGGWVCTRTTSAGG